MAMLTLALLFLGLALLVAEAHLPSMGVLGAAGIVALVSAIALALVGAGGSLLLALGVAVPLAAAAGGLGFVAVTKARAAQRRRARCGAEGLVGRVGVVRHPLDPQGHVLVDGELWRARRAWADEDEPAPAEGDPVVVDHVAGLTLSVRRAEVWEVER
jgi:membrane-bound serine protease (ClpP class)